MTAKSKRTNQVFNLSVSTLKPLPVFVCEYYFYENQIKAKQADLTLFAWVRSWWKTSTCKGQEHGRPGGSMWMWKSTVNKRWTQLVLKGDVYSVWWNVKEMTCWWWCRWPCRNKQIRSQTHCPTVAVSPNWSAKTSRLLQLLACCCGSPFKVKGVSENDQFMRISLFSFTKENEKPSLAKAFLCLH